MPFIIITAVILIALVAGFSIYNIPSNRLSRQLDLGQKDLEEQNYEQSVVEFDKAIAIDPMSVDAYLGKVQAYEGMGDTEKILETLQTGFGKTGDERIKTPLVDVYLEQVSSYMQSADYEIALAVCDKLLELDGENMHVQEAVDGCLMSYVEQLIAKGRYDDAEVLIEKYREKVQGVDFQRYLDEIGELKATVEFQELLSDIPAFDIADIKVMGYDLLGPRAKDIVGALGYSELPDGYSSGVTELQNGVYESVSYNGVTLFEDIGSENVGRHLVSAWNYQEYDRGGHLSLEKVNGKEANASQIGMSRSNLPLKLGDSYEKWCNMLGVDLLKESSLTKEEERRSFDEDLNMNYTNRIYTMSVGDIGGQSNAIVYGEKIYETDVRWGEDADWYWYDYDMIATFSLGVEAENVDGLQISAYFLSGTVQAIYYNFMWRRH